jgi:hypothetical protein
MAKDGAMPAKRRRIDTQPFDIDTPPKGCLVLTDLPPELIERITDFLDDVSFCCARRAHRCLVVRDHACILVGRARAHWLAKSMRDVCCRRPPEALVAHLESGEQPTTDHMLWATQCDNARVVELLCQRFGLVGRQWDETFVDVAAGNGAIATIEVLSRFGFSGSRVALHNAAFARRRPLLGTLQTLHRLGLGEWGPWLMDEAAGRGRCKLVRFLHKRLGQACTADAMDRAAMRGHLNIVEFLHYNRSEGCTTYAMDWAASRGYLSIVEFLHDHRTEGCTTAAMDQAAANGHLDVVEFLHANRTEGCTSAAMDLAAARGHLDIVTFLAEKRSEGNPTTAKQSAGATRQAEVVAYLRRRWPKPPRKRKRQHTDPPMGSTPSTPTGPCD